MLTPPLVSTASQRSAAVPEAPLDVRLVVAGDPEVDGAEAVPAQQGQERLPVGVPDLARAAAAPAPRPARHRWTAPRRRAPGTAATFSPPTLASTPR